MRKAPMVAAVVAVAAVAVGAGAANLQLKAVVGFAAGEDHVVNTTLTHAVALNAFAFISHGGDHKVRTVELLTSGDRATMNLADQNGDDLYSAAGGWLKLGSKLGPNKTAKARCTSNPCNVLLAEPMPGTKFVLQGFHFARVTGGDSNLLRIAVRPNVPAGRVETVFKDNGTFTYDVTIAYTYANSAEFKHEGTASATFKPGSHPQRCVLLNTAVSGQSVIQGFDFRFNNGDHYLYRMQILPAGAGLMFPFPSGSGGHSTQLQASPGTGFEACFGDSQAGDADPFTATIDYAVLKE
jgi:hypothetical protein